MTFVCNCPELTLSLTVVRNPSMEKSTSTNLPNEVITCPREDSSIMTTIKLRGILSALRAQSVES